MGVFSGVFLLEVRRNRERSLVKGDRYSLRQKDEKGRIPSLAISCLTEVWSVADRIYARGRRGSGVLTLGCYERGHDNISEG